MLGAQAQPVDIQELNTCPGALVRLPAVIECIQATTALQQGELGTLFPHAPEAMLEGAMLGVQAFNLYEAELTKKAAGK